MSPSANDGMRLLALMLGLLLVVPGFAFATGIVNGDMETVSKYTIDYCAKLVTDTCWPFTLHSDIWKADTWNTWFHTNDFGQASDDAHGGAWSTAIWYQPPADCGWNFTTSACGITWIGTEGSLVQHDITFDNSSFTISFWSKKGPRPVQCEGIFCYGTQYYGSNATNTGKFIFRLQDTTGSLTNYTSPVFTATDDWAQTLLTVSGVNTSSTFDIVLQNYVADLRQVAPDSVLFDDFAINYSSVSASPANGYIADMTTMTNWPYTATPMAGLAADNTSFRLSKGFQNVPLANITFRTTDPCASRVILNVSLMYPGSSIDVKNFTNTTSMNASALGYWNQSGGGCMRWHVIPLFDYANVRYVNITFNGDTYLLFNWSADMSIRSDYGPTLDGVETVGGSTDLYPVIIYDNSVSGSVHTFKSYNFMSTETSTSNTVFNLYDAAGTLLDTSAESYVFHQYGSATHVKDWVSDTTGTNRINVTFTSRAGLPYRSSTYSLFQLSSALGECSSGCVDTRYRTATLSGSFCTYEYSAVNDTRCWTAPVAPPASGTDFSYTDPLYGDAGGYTPLTIPWVWFVIGSVIIAGIVFYYVHSEQLALATLMILMVTWTGLGILPAWIGIGIIIMIVALLAFLLKKLLPTGGT